MPGTNALAYYEKLLLTEVKSFLTLAASSNVIKLLRPSVMIFGDKLECLSLASLSRIV